ncbi:N-acetyl-gamma-glutamyl-phosphate reductase [uncultured Lacinutrix sp.]|uniref:N-acetyl-gamma-glutamyl-phosphate reductase n=1 Tax=uncultured Lacinutrix sp. TaxID=574032 RepID=UPI0026071DFE|nr:N-acetyl-gamma-glutamyl-phosphate reductase [uncultured Lacinutrix sp.]
MIQVGIIGGAGYTAGELIRVLLNHPKAKLNFIFSTSNAGNKVHNVHRDLFGSTDLKFTSKINTEVDVLFLCLGHGNSKVFLDKNNFSSTTKIIDLSHDFRLEGSSVVNTKNFVYGLPEFQKEAIKKASYIANPGCFATTIQLALLPLANKQKLISDVCVNAVTGATGAGTSLSETTHFTWRDNNFSYYKPFSHQHLGEINQTIGQLQKGFASEINFLPNRGNFSRGIFATAYTKLEDDLEHVKAIYQDYYKDEAFVFISDENIHLKQVVNTNKCILHLYKHGNKLLITSIIDNLLKGASGQAIQNMNLMFGFDETEGLELKANYF